MRLASLSGAMGGGFVGVADVADVMQRIGAVREYRLIGGITVMLHVQRLGLDLPLRATGDADFGVAPHILREPSLIEEIEKLGYRRTLGNRWECSLDDRRTAAVDSSFPLTRRARATPSVDEDESLRRVPAILRRELRAEGPALAVLTDGLQPEAAARMRTRIRALLMEVTGVDA